jgi:hypothetical protein
MPARAGAFHPRHCGCIVSNPEVSPKRQRGNSEDRYWSRSPESWPFNAVNRHYRSVFSGSRLSNPAQLFREVLSTLPKDLANRATPNEALPQPVVNGQP